MRSFAASNPDLFRAGPEARADCRIHRVEQQAGDGHGADAAGYRRDRASPGDCGCEIDVADYLRFAAAIVYTIDADVDDDRALTNPVSRNRLRPADGGHQNFGFAA